MINFTCISQRKCNADPTLANVIKVKDISKLVDTDMVFHSLMRCQTDLCQDETLNSQLIVNNIEYVCLNSSTNVFKECKTNTIALPIEDPWTGEDRLQQYGQCLPIEPEYIYKESSLYKGLYIKLEDTADVCPVQFALNDYTTGGAVYNVIKETKVSKTGAVTAAIC